MEFQIRIESREGHGLIRYLLNVGFSIIGFCKGDSEMVEIEDEVRFV